jgi:hypothetical protein
MIIGALFIRLVMLLGLLLGAASEVNSQTVFIGPLKNTNPKDVSSVWAECETSADGRRMTCDFVQIRVDLVKTPEAATAELEKQLKEFKDSAAQDIAKTCRDDRKQMADLAAGVAANKDLSSRFKAFMTGFVQRFNAMCEKPTMENIRNYLGYHLEKDTKTCKILANPWKETFTRQLGDKWVSNRGPSGICGVVIISTLEGRPLDPKKPDGVLKLWTYKTQKVVTNREAGGQLCFFEETKVQYSWQAKDFDRSCEFIEFGF